MDRGKHLDSAVKKLGEILDRNADGLPPSKIESKWSALADVVAKVEMRAKQRGPQPSRPTRRPVRKHA